MIFLFNHDVNSILYNALIDIHTTADCNIIEQFEQAIDLFQNPANILSGIAENILNDNLIILFSCSESDRKSIQSLFQLIYVLFFLLNLLSLY